MEAVARDHVGCSLDKTILEFWEKCNFVQFDLYYVLVGSLVFFQVMEFLVKKFSEGFKSYKACDEADKLRWCNKTISALHAILSSAGSITVLAMESQTWENPPSGYSPRFLPVLFMSVGYFIYDLISYLRQYIATGAKPQTSMLVHHIICVVAIQYCVAYRIGLLYCMTLLAMEITTPLLQATWMLKKAGLGNSVIFKINGIAFIVSFFIFRVVWSILQIVHLYVYRITYMVLPWWFSIPITVPGLLCVLNCYWFVLILRLAIKGDQPADQKRPAQPLANKALAKKKEM